MSFPSFATGEVLTAADMNAVGMWLVKEETIGATVTAVAVDDAFTSDFVNYRVLVQGGTQSVANSVLLMQLTAGGTPSPGSYFGTFVFTSYATSALSVLNTNSGSNWPYVAMALGNNSLSGGFDIYQPSIASRTSFGGFTNRGDISGYVSGYHDIADPYDGFTLSINAGTMTGGVVRVYGYRD